MDYFWPLLGVAVALLGVAVGLIVGAVSIHHSRKQYALDEGSKRAEVCVAIARFLGEVSGTGQAPQDALNAFYRATEPNLVFHLFGHDGRAYIAELRAKAHDLLITGTLEADDAFDEERKRRLTMKRLQLVEWMGIQESEIQRRLGCQKSIGRQ